MLLAICDWHAINAENDFPELCDLICTFAYFNVSHLLCDCHKVYKMKKVQSSDRPTDVCSKRGFRRRVENSPLLLLGSAHVVLEFF